MRRAVIGNATMKQLFAGIELGDVELSMVAERGEKQ